MTSLFQPVIHHAQRLQLASRVLLRHWMVVYPLLLYHIIMDMVMSQAIPALSTTQSAQYPKWIGVGLFCIITTVVFSAGWINLLVHVLKQYQQQPTENKTAWGAFLEGVGSHSGRFIAGWTVYLAGLAAIVWGIHTQLVAHNGYPELLQTAPQWLNNHPEATAEAFNGYIMEQINTATPALRQQLDVFSKYTGMGVTLGSVWLVANLFWPAVMVLTPASWPTCLWRGYGVFLKHWPIYIALLTVCYISMLLTVLLVGVVPFLAPIIWLVLMFVTAWILLYACQCVVTLAPKWLPPASTEAPSDSTPIADA